MTAAIKKRAQERYIRNDAKELEKWQKETDKRQQAEIKAFGRTLTAEERLEFEEYQQQKQEEKARKAEKRRERLDRILENVNKLSEGSQMDSLTDTSSSLLEENNAALRRATDNMLGLAPTKKRRVEKDFFKFF